jgi:L-asparaginase
VALVLTGGTINSVGSSPLDLAHYGETGLRLGDEELLMTYPQVGAAAQVTPIAFRSAASAALGPGDWIDLALLLDRLIATEGYDAAVVAYGTSTLEEVAYFIDLVTPWRDRTVFVGAMRPPSGLGSDAGINLVRAVEVACSPQRRGLGVVVVMNDTIHAARDVTKAATYRVDAFRSIDTGPLGAIGADGEVRIHHRPVRDPPLQVALADLDGLPRVDVVVSYAGADGVLVDASVGAGARGLVSAGSGAGRVTPAEAAALDRAAAAGVVVCRCSRVGSGWVARSASMRAAGVVAGNNLPPWKARVLLMAALTVTDDPEAVQQIFDRA